MGFKGKVLTASTLRALRSPALPPRGDTQTRGGRAEQRRKAPFSSFAARWGFLPPTLNPRHEPGPGHNVARIRNNNARHRHLRADAKSAAPRGPRGALREPGPPQPRVPEGPGYGGWGSRGEQGGRSVWASSARLPRGAALPGGILASLASHFCDTETR